jgi:hypothetical protein
MTMRRTIRGSIVAALAGALALSALDLGPAQAVPVKQQQASGPATLDLSARRRHHRYYRHYGSNRAALRCAPSASSPAPSPASPRPRRRAGIAATMAVAITATVMARRPITIAPGITTIIITVTNHFMARRSQKAACLADVNPIDRAIGYSAAHD